MGKLLELQNFIETTSLYKDYKNWKMATGLRLALPKIMQAVTPKLLFLERVNGYRTSL